MALQGDGNGIVTIPQAIATGDFSVVFTGLEVTSSTDQVVIGDNSSTNNFIASLSGGRLQAKVAGTTSAYYTAAGGTVLKYELARVGGSVSVYVNDVLQDTFTAAGDFTLDALFTFNSNQLKYTGLLSGTLSMVGFSGAGDRLYDFEGSGTTLVDTISGENGTLSGFTTGGFTAVEPPTATVNEIVLLIGQSNMVGMYGPVDPVLDATDEQIYQYGSTAKEIIIASDPLDHLNEWANTVGMGLSFGKEYLAAGLEVGSEKVLLVPAASAGSSFSSGFWRAGGTGYNNAIARTNEAIAASAAGSSIKAILWHQGESDRDMTEAEYAAELDSLITDLRSLITGASNIPFVVGGIKTTSTQYGAGVQAALVDLPNRVSRTAFVDVEDLALGADSLHFTAATQRTLGARYYTGYLAAVDNTPAGAVINLSISGMPDGTYRTILHDSLNVEVYNDDLVYTSEAAQISTSLGLGAYVTGLVTDNSEPPISAAKIKAIVEEA